MLAIETHGLTRLFDGKPAVQDLSLAVPAGAFYGFLGPNGAGKSTTIKMLTGLLAPTSGRAAVLGTDLARDPLAVKRQVGVVPDGLGLFERLTGAEQLRIHGQLYGLPRAEAARRADELLGALELADQAGKLVGEYSHGMKKKLALGCALIHGPRLLFLDEPFEGIDAVAVSGIRGLLQDLVARGAMTIFLTSHVLEVVERLVTHVGIVREGRLAAQGTLEEVRGAAETLEQVFIRTVGEERPRPGLSWLGEGGAA
ncbi:ABC transporter ATP-binding protein [Anaeromyxobacter sp. PSR-1]|uniref:ABC transporter ATP-binding protein n=1 Tax=unclassified Anaeromyxobacter TaxID=2620896 RepID=UPI0005DAA7DB|nr:ABC transporter ATP-binding protein [Anaeromyxobacter sp. PSR-1]GAO01861.1 bacitracin transport ATP-binding protein BcrA [Anaeromyxobacter sp. PSR-1]